MEYVSDLHLCDDEALKHILQQQTQMENMDVISKIRTPMIGKRMSKPNMMKHIMKHKKQLEGVSVKIPSLLVGRKKQKISHQSSTTTTKTIVTTTVTTTTTINHNNQNIEKDANAEMQDDDIKMVSNDYFADLLNKDNKNKLVIAEFGIDIKNNNENNDNSDSSQDFDMSTNNNKVVPSRQSDSKNDSNEDDNDNKNETFTWEVDPRYPGNKWLLCEEKQVKIMLSQLPSDFTTYSQLLHSTLTHCPFSIKGYHGCRSLHLGHSRTHNISYFSKNTDLTYLAPFFGKNFVVTALR